MEFFYNIGRFCILIARAFKKPDKFSVFLRNTMDEIYNLGIGSMGIVSIISVFMGAVVVIQTASNIDSPLLPSYTVGFTARQTIVLEFSPTIVALILAGMVGSRIASQIGTMRVSEQIDALEIMGVNSASYLIAPKIIAAMVINPFIIMLSMFLGLFGGWLVGIGIDIVTTPQYIYGIRYDFEAFSVVYALIKTVVFAFIITAIPAYHGYYTRGGSLEVGKSSTKGIIYSSVTILLFNYILTQILLI